MADFVHVNPKGSWKKVKIDPNLFPKSDLDGILTLEELTDYEIVKVDKHERKKLAKQKKKKEKTKRTGLESSVNEDSRAEYVSKERKKQKKKKIKRTQSEEEKLVHDKFTHSESEAKGIKKRKRKMEIQKEGKSGKAIRHHVLDVGEEIEKLQPENERRRKKRKKQKSEGGGPSPKKKAKFEKHIFPLDDTDLVKDMKSWKDLFVPVPVLRALKENGFLDPTPIQAQVLPHAIRDKLDILGAAETGSGKTLAFGIPLMHYILEEKKQRTIKEQDSSSQDDSGVEQDESTDEVTEGVNSESDNDGSDTEFEKDDTDLVFDDEDSGDDNDQYVNQSSEEDIENDSEEFETIVVDETGDMTEEKADEDSSSEEELEPLGAAQRGCVKVIKDVDFGWMNPETSATAKPTRRHPLGLILEPTRELAIQVKNHLLAAAKYTDISVAVIVGGLAMQKQRRILKRCPDIIVATPGRLWELIQEGEVYLSRIEETRHLVIDEADRMVEKGHFEELSQLLRRMNVDEKLRNGRHTYVFSATLTLLHSGPQRILKEKKKVKLDENQKLALLMKNIGLKDKPKVIDLSRKVGTVETLTEARINCSKEEKDVYLYYFLKQYPGRTLVFTNSKDCIRRLVSVFTLLQCCPLPLHADMHQRQRLKNLERFSGNPNGLLLASDVAARGLDIPNVEHVIHYQVPHTVENYVHRSGRTARASKEGLSVVLLSPQDIQNYRKIMHTLNKSEDLPLFPVEQEYLSEVKQRVNIVRQIETQEYRFKKKKHQNDWFRKAADEIGVDIDDENLLNDLGDDREQAKHKQYIKQMKTELEILLKRPILPHFFGGKYPTKSGKLATLPQREMEKDAIKHVKKDKKLQDKMKARDALRPQLARHMKPKKRKWKKKKKH